jgi:hypothetical protein
VELRYFVVLVAAVAGASAACTRVESPDPSPGVSLTEGGVGGEGSSGAGSLAGGGGEGGDRDYQSEGGALGTLELGVWPTFASDPQQSLDVQAVRAAVSALSIGATTLPLAERWDQLSGATGSPRLATWNRLDAMTKPFRDRGESLALCIDIVDREQPAWPFTTDLEGASATSAIERTIDEVYARYSSYLTHLCFGYELDRYLAVASSGDAARLLAFLDHAVAYASHHPLRSTKTLIGSAVTLQALLGPSDSLSELLLLGDEVVAVYDPLDADASLKPPASVVDDLSAALENLKATGVRRQLTLFEVGYPSSASADLSSSEAEQKAFYEALFGLLDGRRDDFGFIGVYGLGDRAAADCEAEALAFGAVSEPALLAARATARCSMGLRAERPETEKPAWQDVAAALSRYQ